MLILTVQNIKERKNCIDNMPVNLTEMTLILGTTTQSTLISDSDYALILIVVLAVDSALKN